MITDLMSKIIADIDVELRRVTYEAKLLSEKLKLLKLDQQSLLAIYEQEGDNFFQKNFYGIYRDGTRIYDFKSNEQSFGEDLFGSKKIADIHNKESVNTSNVKEVLRRNEVENKKATIKYAKERAEEIFNENQENWEKELLRRNSEKELKDLYEDLEDRGITVSGEVVKEKIESLEETKNLVQEIAEEYAQLFPNDLVEVHKS